MNNKKIAFAVLLSISMGSASAAVDYYSAVPVADLETFFGATPGAITAASADPGYDPAFEGAGIKDSFGFIAGDIVSFDYNFMTDELSPDLADDYAFVSIGGNITRLDHVLGSMLYETSHPDNYYLETGYLSFAYTALETGTLDFGIGIVDAFDEVVDSALLIDNIKITRGTTEVYRNGFEDFDPLGMAIGDVAIGPDFLNIGPTEGSYQALITTASVPLPPAVWLLFSGFIAVIGFSRHQRRGC